MNDYLKEYLFFQLIRKIACVTMIPFSCRDIGTTLDAVELRLNQKSPKGNIWWNGLS